MASAEKEAAAAVALLLCSWVPGALESQEMARRSLFPKHDQKQSQQLHSITTEPQTVHKNVSILLYTFPK